MDSRERINARYGMALASVIAAAVAFTFWQNAAYNAANRANAYSAGDDPTRTLLVLGLVAVAGGIAAVVVMWTRKLRSLNGASQSRPAVQQPQD